MFKKGFAHIVSLIVIAVVVAGAFSALSIRREEAQKEAVGKVLSSSDDINKGSSSGSSGSSAKSDDEDQDKTTTSGSSGSGSSNTVKVESRSGQSKTQIESNSKKTEIKTESEEGKFETKIENGKEETKIRSGNLRIEIKTENGVSVLKVKNENDEEVELEDEEEDELLEELEDELEEDDIEIATGSAQVGFIQKGHKVRTNFPLSVNPATGELFVTTPAGEKVVAILPDVAIQNMIRAGILTRVEEEPEPQASPSPEGTSSAQPPEGTTAASVAGAGIELTQENNEAVYLISGVKDEKFLGLFPAGIKLKAIVAVDDGNLLDIRQGFFSRLLDLLSF